MKKIWKYIRETIAEFLEDKAPRLAAALSYYTVMSLAPLVIIAISIASLFFSQSTVQQQLIGQIEGMVGPTGAEAIQSILENASQPGSGGVIASVVSIAVLLFGASGVFGQLQDSLNTAFDVEARPDVGIMATIKDRFLSFTMVLGIGFLLLVSLILSTVLSAMGTFFSNTLPGGEAVWQVINFAISFAVITLLFALMYKYLPDVNLRWRHVWVGAIITALLFNIGKFGISLYLGRSTVASTYGAAGSLVVLLLWVYYSALILLLGAEFSQVYAYSQGDVSPKPHARFLTAERRAQQGLATRRPMKGGRKVSEPPPATGWVDMGRPEMIPVTGELPKEAGKALPVLAAGSVAAVVGVVEIVRYSVSGIRARSARPQPQGVRKWLARRGKR